MPMKSHWEPMRSCRGQREGASPGAQVRGVLGGDQAAGAWAARERARRRWFSGCGRGAVRPPDAARVCA
eukprot:scaffold7730_cov110-Isochrysis_galbana.AAC.7